MNFTSNMPTVSGFYAWRRDARSGVLLTNVLESEGRIWPAFTGGLWCRLVPAEETGRAYKEGFLDYHQETQENQTFPMMTPGWVTVYYNKSRAKRVAEGRE